MTAGLPEFKVDAAVSIHCPRQPLNQYKQLKERRMSQEAKLIHLYTTADTWLDLPETQVLESKAGVTTSGRALRKVAVPEEEHNVQVKTYVSKLESALTEHEWKCEIQFGNIIPLQEQA